MRQAADRSPVPWWTGLPFTAAAAAAWIVLALNSPTTTYHFAPMVAAAAWPVALRLRVGLRLSAKAVSVAAGRGIAVALAVTLALASTGALAGPTFFGTPHALAESLVMAGIGAVIGVLFARRTVRSNDGNGRSTMDLTKGSSDG